MLAGWNMLRETQSDLILVELPMPGLNAAACLRRFGAAPGAVRESVPVSDAPVIALSSPGLPGLAERCRELGFDDHLSKRFRRSEVLAMLNRPLRPSAPADSKDTAEPARADAVGANPPGTPMLDPGALARLTELDPAGENRLLERVLHAFQASVARLRPQLDAGRASGDLAAIRLVAHTLKSSSASIGATGLSQLCGQIETAIRIGTQADLGGELDALGAALDGALQAIETLLKERA